MSLSVPTKAAALLEAVTAEDLQALRPAERQRLVQACRHVADMAETQHLPHAGVLARLRKGERAQ